MSDVYRRRKKERGERADRAIDPHLDTSSLISVSGAWFDERKGTGPKEDAESREMQRAGRCREQERLRSVPGLHLGCQSRAFSPMWGPAICQDCL
jgi:hypothetical protein